MPAPIGGWNPDAPFHTMPNTQAPILDNFVIDPTGKIAMRSPMSLRLDLQGSLTLPLSLCGMINNRYGTAFSRRASGNTDSFYVPILNALSGQTQAATTLYFVRTDVSPAVLSTSTITRDQAPGFRWINFDGLLYGLSCDSTTMLSPPNNSYSIPATNLLTYGYTAITAGGPSVLSSAPRGGLDLCGHQSRIWILGGADTPNGGTVHRSTSLFFSNPIQSGAGGAASDWKDPISGLTNQITLDNDSSDPGIGLARTRNAVVVFRLNSVWAIRGTTTNTYTAVLLSRMSGCVDSRSIVETDRGVFFLGRAGLMFTDGVQVRNVSGVARATIQSAINQASILFSTAAPICQCKLTAYRDHIVISILANTATGNTYGVWTGLYNITTGAWSRITSNLWNGDHQGGQVAGQAGFLAGSAAQGTLVSIGDRYVVSMDDPATGTSCAAPYGIAVGNNVGFYDQISTATSAPYTQTPIPALWQTRLFPLGSAARKDGKPTRWFVDYVMQANNASAPPGWTVTPIDASRTSLGSAVAPGINGPLFPGTSSVYGSNGIGTMIQRYNSDFLNELVDLAFQVSFQDPSPPTGAQSKAATAELHGIGVEFQPARQLR